MRLRICRHERPITFTSEFSYDMNASFLISKIYTPKGRLRVHVQGSGPGPGYGLLPIAVVPILKVW
jgi:hypothetical protein